jgi:uncharacterized spore protein YtfJ
MLKLEEIVDHASESIGAKRVFGEPYEKNGVTVIPAARVMGGVGGGEGTAPGVAGETTDLPREGTPGGFGAGYGMSGRPAGAFVIRGEEVKWLPAIDVNRLMFGFQVVMIVFFLMMRSIMKARAAARAEATK